MTYYFYMPFFKSLPISTTGSGANRTVCGTAPLSFVLNLRLGLFIINIYLQQVILSKIFENDQGLDKVVYYLN